MKTLPKNRKVDRWHEAMVSENIWHQWFLVGIVESETMLSRSALAHIFDNVKAKASPSIGSAKRGLLIVHRRNHFKVRYCIISCELISFPICSCAAAAAAGGRRVNHQSPEKKSPRCLHRHRRRGPGCGGGRSPRDRGIAG